MAKAILDAIEQLEIYITRQVQIWNDIRQKYVVGSPQYFSATARWEAYRDMANRLTDLAEATERILNEGKGAD